MTEEQDTQAAHGTDEDPGAADAPQGAPLSLNDLADVGRFQFEKDTVDLPEIGGYIVCRTLSVAERDALPDLTKIDPDSGKEVPDVSVDKLAEIFAATVCEPKATLEQAKQFLPGWPATALDKVIEKFGELVGVDEEAREAAGAFPDGR